MPDGESRHQGMLESVAQVVYLRIVQSHDGDVIDEVADGDAQRLL